MFAGVSSSSRAICPNTEMRRRERRWDSEVKLVISDSVVQAAVSGSPGGKHPHKLAHNALKHAISKEKFRLTVIFSLYPVICISDVLIFLYVLYGLYILCLFCLCCEYISSFLQKTLLEMGRGHLSPHPTPYCPPHRVELQNSELSCCRACNKLTTGPRNGVSGL